jgi:two-component system, OmpR family, response regulator
MEEGERVKIAVLDDNPAISEMLQLSLELAGHTVIAYTSPSKFLADINAQVSAIASAPFDLIIVDLLLPERISGVEVIHRVRKVFPDLPVILISAGSSQEIEAARKALPTVIVLRKPFKMATLLAMIQELST